MEHSAQWPLTSDNWKTWEHGNGTGNGSNQKMRRSLVATLSPRVSDKPELAPYGMYFVSKFNALKFNGKDIDYRECNGFKVSILVH